MKKSLIHCGGTRHILRLIAAAAVGVLIPVAHAQTGLYTLSGGTASQSGKTYIATTADQLAVYVLSSGELTLTSSTNTGDSSNVTTSSQYGLNAGVLAASAGEVTITGGTVTTNAKGSNGLFATGTGSSVSMYSGSISTSGKASHGVDVTYGGAITLNNVHFTTQGASVDRRRAGLPP